MKKEVNLFLVTKTLLTIKSLLPLSEVAPLMRLMSELREAEESLRTQLKAILQKPNTDETKSKLSEEYANACSAHIAKLQLIVDQQFKPLSERLLNEILDEALNDQLKRYFTKAQYDLRLHLAIVKKMQLNKANLRSVFSNIGERSKLTALLGGVSVTVCQMIDPFGGGFLDEKGELQVTEGYCGGCVLWRIEQQTEGHNTQLGPILADQSILEYQVQQRILRDKYAYITVYGELIDQFDFRKWLSSIKQGDTFYIALTAGPNSIGHAINITYRYDGTWQIMDNNESEDTFRNVDDATYFFRKLILDYRASGLFFTNLHIFKALKQIENNGRNCFPPPEHFDAALLLHDPVEREETLVKKMKDALFTYFQGITDEDSVENQCTIIHGELFALIEYAKRPETLESIKSTVEELLTDDELPDEFKDYLKKHPEYKTKLNELTQLAQSKMKKVVRASLVSPLQNYIRFFDTINKTVLGLLSFYVGRSNEYSKQLNDETLSQPAKDSAFANLVNATRAGCELDKIRKVLKEKAWLSHLRNGLMDELVPETMLKELDALLPGASRLLNSKPDDIEALIRKLVESNASQVSLKQMDAIQNLQGEITARNKIIVLPAEKPTSFKAKLAYQRELWFKQRLSDFAAFLDGEIKNLSISATTFAKVQSQVRARSYDLFRVDENSDPDYQVAIVAYREKSMAEINNIDTQVIDKLEQIHALLTDHSANSLRVLITNHFNGLMVGADQARQVFLRDVRDHMFRQMGLIVKALDELTIVDSECARDANTSVQRIMQTFDAHFQVLLNASFQVDAKKIDDAFLNLMNHQRYVTVYTMLLNELDDMIDEQEKIIRNTQYAESNDSSSYLFNLVTAYHQARFLALVKRREQATQLREQFLNEGSVGISTLIDRMQSVFAGSNVDFNTSTQEQLAPLARNYFNRVIADNPKLQETSAPLQKVVDQGLQLMTEVVEYVDKPGTSVQKIKDFVECRRSSLPLLTKRDLSNIVLRTVVDKFRDAVSVMKNTNQLSEQALALLPLAEHLSLNPKALSDSGDNMRMTDAMIKSSKSYVALVQASHLQEMLNFIIQQVDAYAKQHGHVPGIATMKFTTALSALVLNLKVFRDSFIQDPKRNEFHLMFYTDLRNVARSVNKLLKANVLDEQGLVPDYRRKLFDALESLFITKCNNPLQTQKDNAAGLLKRIGLLGKTKVDADEERAKINADQQALTQFRYPF